MGASATARLSIKAVAKIARFFRVLQQKREIKTSGKKVSLVAMPKAQAKPVNATMAGIRSSRIDVASADVTPSPNRNSNCFGVAEGAISTVQRQTVTMLNGTTMRSDPKNIVYESTLW